MATDNALEDFAAALGVSPLSSGEQQLLLDCARDVAHGSQRRYAPLSTFLLGVAAASAPDRRDAVERGVSAIRSILGSAAGEDPPVR